MKFLADIEVEEGLKDSSGDLGSNGQVLSSTGSGTNWITSTTGVTQITAGTNVTISPAGGTGNVTINAAGGGGIGGSIAVTQLALGSGTANEIQGSSKLTFAFVSGGLGYDKLKIGDGSTGSNQVLLDINTLGTASSRGRLTLNDAGTQRGFLGITGGDTEVTLLSVANLILDSGSTDDVIITTNSGSNVGIGNTAPTYKLEVTGTGSFSSTLRVVSTVTASNFILSSDERLKENIKDLEVKNINTNWKSFNVKDSDEGYRVGVVAQELEVKHPEFVETDKEGFKSVKYIDLLISKIAELEDRIKQLEK